MQMPDFIVVGAARAGTTTLHSYLRQHPEIFLPANKEPCFFIFEEEPRPMKEGKFAFAIRTEKEYSSLFRMAKPGQKTGEMSTPYLYLHERAITAMKKYDPDYSEIKIVILLRNPAERAYSQYLWRVRDGREKLSFEEAIEAEPERIKDNYSFDYFYVDRGFYSKQVNHYLREFKHVHLILYEDFIQQTHQVLEELCRFIGVEGSFPFKPVVAQNSSALPKSALLSRMITAESRVKFRIWHSLPDPARKKIRQFFTGVNKKNGDVPRMQESTHQRLVEVYRDDIMALSGLIGKDLTKWLL